MWTGTPPPKRPATLPAGDPGQRVFIAAAIIWFAAIGLVRDLIDTAGHACRWIGRRP